MDTVILVFLVISFIQSQTALIVAVLAYLKIREQQAPQMEFEVEEEERRVPRVGNYEEYAQDFQELIS